MSDRRNRLRQVEDAMGQMMDMKTRTKTIEELMGLKMSMGISKEEARRAAEEEIKFQEDVWAACDGKCRCGKDTGITVQLIYPLFLGGRRVLENAILMCDGCLLKRERGVSEYVRGRWGILHTRVNFEVARELYKRFQALCEDEGKSVSSVLRELVVAWVGVRDSRPAMESQYWMDGKKEMGK